MAMSARVTSSNGRIIGEKRNGQRRYHQHDALGNTTALIDDAGTVANTFSHWPYGDLRYYSDVKSLFLKNDVTKSG